MKKERKKNPSKTSTLTRDAKQHMQTKEYTYRAPSWEKRRGLEKRQKVLKGARIEVRKWEIAVSECGCVVFVKEREERREKWEKSRWMNIMGAMSGFICHPAENKRDTHSHTKPNITILSSSSCFLIFFFSNFFLGFSCFVWEKKWKMERGFI